MRFDRKRGRRLRYLRLAELAKCIDGGGIRERTLRKNVGGARTIVEQKQTRRLVEVDEVRPRNAIFDRRHRDGDPAVRDVQRARLLELRVAVPDGLGGPALREDV